MTDKESVLKKFRENKLELEVNLRLFEKKRLNPKLVASSKEEQKLGVLMVGLKLEIRLMEERIKILESL